MKCPQCGSREVMLLLYEQLLTPEQVDLMHQGLAVPVGDVAAFGSPLLMKPIPKWRCENYHYFGRYRRQGVKQKGNRK